MSFANSYQRFTFFDNYQDFVNRTCNARLDNRERLANSAMGLCGEAAEVLVELRNNYVFDQKELGDIMWYVALGTSAIDTRFSLVEYVSEAQACLYKGNTDLVLAEQLCIHAGLTADIVKKHLHQDNPLAQGKFYTQLVTLMAILRTTCESCGTTLEDVAQQNIDKLTARYPEGTFSVERSINRKE